MGDWITTISGKTRIRTQTWNKIFTSKIVFYQSTKNGNN